MLRNLLDTMDNCPVLRAAFAQNDVFYVDCETGTQRWKGYKTTKEIEDTLLKCKFSSENIEAIVKECQQTHHTSLPKVI